MSKCLLKLSDSDGREVYVAVSQIEWFENARFVDGLDGGTSLHMGEGFLVVRESVDEVGRAYTEAML